MELDTLSKKSLRQKVELYFLQSLVMVNHTF